MKGLLSLPFQAQFLKLCSVLMRTLSPKCLGISSTPEPLPATSPPPVTLPHTPHTEIGPRPRVRRCPGTQGLQEVYDSESEKEWLRPGRMQHPPARSPLAPPQDRGRGQLPGAAGVSIGDAGTSIPVELRTRLGTLGTTSPCFPDTSTCSPPKRYRDPARRSLTETNKMAVRRRSRKSRPRTLRTH